MYSSRAHLTTYDFLSPQRGGSDFTTIRHPSLLSPAISAQTSIPGSTLVNSGKYYGVFLGEPPKGFPTSQLSSVQGSPVISSHSRESQETGTSNGSSYRQSIVVHPSSSVAFPTATLSYGNSSRNSPPYSTIRAPEILSGRRRSTSSIQPLQSILKRDRRKSLASSNTSLNELPSNDLQTACRTVTDFAAQCYASATSSSVSKPLRDVISLLKSVQLTLSTIVQKQVRFTPEDVIDISNSFQNLQNYLKRTFGYHSSHSRESDELHRYVSHFSQIAARLKCYIQIHDLEAHVSTLTYEHNVSQCEMMKVRDDSNNIKRELRQSRQLQRTTIREKQDDLTMMHAERVRLRDEIALAKKALSKAKKERDAVMGIKTVRFS